MFLGHIGTQRCSKFVVKCGKIVVLRGFRGYFGANSGSAVAYKQNAVTERVAWIRFAWTEMLDFSAASVYNLVNNLNLARCVQ